jgi:two-component system, chemotaxis family, response regulator Rcp1
VEDNPADVRMIRYALAEEKGWATEIVVSSDGEKAIDLLLQKNTFVLAEKPDLVILDLNLPKRDGAEILQIIRTTERLREVPVVVLSSSPEDVILNIIRAAHVEANCYLTKPTDVDQFLALGRTFRHCVEGPKFEQAALEESTLDGAC